VQVLSELARYGTALFCTLLRKLGSRQVAREIQVLYGTGGTLQAFSFLTRPD
jgi:hypothetical protein